MKSSSVRRRVVDQATAYAKAVVAGKVVAGHLQRLACERHLRDRKTGKARGLKWDATAAARGIRFFPTVLRLAEGEHAGKPFQLQPIQQFIVGSLFGWKNAEGFRRFRTAYIEMGKGSGKTPLAAGIGIYGFTADQEQAAEVYSAATMLDQAKICYRDAERMVKASPLLSERVDVTVSNLSHPGSGSFFRPVSSEHKGLDGKRVHMAMVDELHEHPNALVVDKMRAGTKGRRQALIVEITNSGYDRHSVCYQHHEYSEKILQGSLEDDSWFALVCGLDPCTACRNEGQTQPKDGCDDCDDWRDPKVWRKANPTLGVTIREDYLAGQVREAIGMPAKQNIVKRLNFCIWTEQSTKAIDMALWDLGKAPIDVESLKGQSCYGGLDLAQVSDLSAFALVFPQEGPTWPVLWWLWVPEDDIRIRALRDRVPYDVWVREGLIRTTPGNTTDYNFIQRDVIDLAAVYDIQEIAFDRTFTGQIIQNLQAELGEERLVQFGQGFLSMASPTAELLRRVKAGELQHGNHPVARWAASNLSLATDAAGNLKPDKEHSTERIDPIVAAIMGLGRAMLSAPAGGEGAEIVWL